MSEPEKIKTHHGELEVEKKAEGDRLTLTLIFHLGQDCLLHWGLSRTPNGPWLLPPEETRPGKTHPYDNHAVQTAISPNDSIQIRVKGGEYDELPFVLYFPLKNEWDNNHGRNYHISLPEKGDERKPSKERSDGEGQSAASQIIEKETSRNSWTLMHRYNLCYEMLDRLGDQKEVLALLFVWLRYSALRQLDWQRNYNTKPRELSHAQQRLTSRVAQLYQEQPVYRTLARLLLTTMGHGGEGQRIRDEILEIMHRYGIREVSEIFMEQWHQKMHNNTTPDDVVICEAYLAFLRSNGDTHTFYRRLEEGGVTRHRLESFDRPIIAQPDFYADKKEAMIRDFEHFLGTLKSVHSATDLGTSLQAAKPRFDDVMRQLADFIWGHRHEAGSEATPLLQKVTELRHRILTQVASGGVVPDLLCLDVSLEDFFRTVVERSVAIEMGEETFFEWLALTLDGFLLTQGEQDLSLCLLQWSHIRKSGSLDLELTLQAESVLDRIERTVTEMAYRFRLLLQPKAELLGKAFHADPWTIRLFSEEILRGGVVFVLSTLSHRLRQLLRKKAELSSWQPVSWGGGKGRLKVIDTLDAVQGRRFDPPAILIVDRIRGEEDLPEGAVAVLTSGSVDVVSHVAIRARNQGVLLATCYDEETLEKLRSWDGRFMEVGIGASGIVRLEAATESLIRSGTGDREPTRSVQPPIPKPPSAPYAITGKEFKEGWVGGKSLHLKQLRGRIPDWISLPVSVALPFGTFEKILSTKVGEEIRRRYERLSSEVPQDPKMLQELRQTVMELVEPEDFGGALREVMERAGLHPAKDREKTWECIKSVWASKWNDRAYYNRKARGIPDENLLMAVLIQEVVPAKYAYIVHTVHPFSGNAEEVYVEVVLGLGETLAGNHPGRALGSVWHKTSGVCRLLNFPSKSIGLYGGGLIFRSDSNAEDLAGYAGAGLYSSFPLTPPEEVHLNYTDDPLVQDRAFRREFLSKVGKLSVLIEEAMGSPQDIEGAFDGERYYVVQTRPQVGLRGQER
jgi:alpha-glucan,water dikinase